MKLKELNALLSLNLTDAQITALEPVVRVKAKAVKTDAKFVATEKQIEGKVPLQMRQAIGILGETPVSIKDWAAKLSKVEGFKTQQDPVKIVAFYRKRMVEEGYAKQAA